ncbi:hypothetical protein CsSME_00037503 [Camellia sinensis var. sinensis]
MLPPLLVSGLTKFAACHAIVVTMSSQSSVLFSLANLIPSPCNSCDTRALKCPCTTALRGSLCPSFCFSFAGNMLGRLLLDENTTPESPISSSSSSYPKKLESDSSSSASGGGGNHIRLLFSKSNGFCNFWH